MLRWLCLVIAFGTVSAAAAQTASPSYPPYRGEAPHIPDMKGRGGGVSPPFRAVEGGLDIRILHETSTATSYMSVTLEHDNNLDGTFCGKGDVICMSIWQGAYGDIQDVDQRVSRDFMGGAARYRVDAPGDWTIITTSRPRPMHSIVGMVRQPVIVDGKVYGNDTSSGAAGIVAISDRGERFEVTGGDYGSFTIPVYRDTGYTITAEKRQSGHYVKAEPARVEQVRFQGSDTPHFRVDAGTLHLNLATERKTVHIRPDRPIRIEGLKRGTVAIVPDRPLRIVGLAHPPVEIVPATPIVVQGLALPPVEIEPARPLRIEGLADQKEEK